MLDARLVPEPVSKQPPRKKKKRPVDPERAATKFVKTATNPVTAVST